MRYLRWLQEQRFEHPAHHIALQELVDAVRISKELLDRIEAVIEQFLPTWSLAPVVRALQALRGVALIVAVTFATEIGDVRRLDSPRQLTGYLGLVPSVRPVILSDAAALPRPAIAACVTCWWKVPGPTAIHLASAQRSSIGSSKPLRSFARSRGRRRAG